MRVGSMLEAINKLVVRTQLEQLQKKQDAVTTALTKRNSSQPERRMATAEVAELLGRHRKTIERWTRERGLPCKHQGRNLIFRRGDVLQWQAQQER